MKAMIVAKFAGFSFQKAVRFIGHLATKLKLMALVGSEQDLNSRDHKPSLS